MNTFAIIVAFTLICALSFAVAELKEAPDGSVCANMCSGHGDCVDYHCKCHVGYHGDSCGVTFVEDENNIVPILSVGNFSLSRKNFTSTVKKYSKTGMLVGFSAHTCFKCIRAENEYVKLMEALHPLKIPFARADVDKMRSLAKENNVAELPSLVFYHKNSVLRYNGVPSTDAIVTYLKKVTGPAAKVLKSVDEVEAFIRARKPPVAGQLATTKVAAIGFFSEHEDVEEDDYEDFMASAKELQTNEEVFFGVVTDPDVCTHYKSTLKVIDRTPSVYVVGEADTPQAVNLDEFFDQTRGLSEWIVAQSIPIVGKLTPYNFQLYDRLPKPMLMLFLNLTDEMEVVGDKMGLVVGGKSGGILNELLVAEFKLAAAELSDKITFVYIDGIEHQDKMRALGLFGGAERLPSMAFNTREHYQAPFPEEYGVNKDNILQFCADFLSGKIRSAQDSKDLAKKALQKATPLNPKNMAKRKERKNAPESKRGVAESFGDGAEGDDAIVHVTMKNFEEVCMDEEKDVLLLIHARECEACFNFAVYFKRMAARFKDLKIPSLVIARMDITDEAPPAALNLISGTLPELLMMPANAKHAPWPYYSGVGKVQEMMYWVQSEASIPFEMPNLPHLTESNRQLYKEQIREREEYKAQQRDEEAEAMKQEEQARALWEHRRAMKEQENKGTSGPSSTTTHVTADGDGVIIDDDSDEF